jgi:signal transduction histidine kinase/ligand-binding sensor domain-containing protein
MRTSTSDEGSGPMINAHAPARSDRWNARRSGRLWVMLGLAHVCFASPSTAAAVSGTEQVASSSPPPAALSRSPPVGSPPVGSPPVGLPPVGLPSGSAGTKLNTAPSEHIFTHLDEADGLKSARVMAVHQTSDGVMWFGTEEGVNRYDGVGITSFAHRPGDPQSLGGATVTSLAGDNELWVGMTNGGLDRIDTNTSAISHYPAAASPPGSEPNDPKLFPDPNGSTLALATDGNGVWIGTGSAGLVYLDIASERFERVEGTAGAVTSIAVDRRRDVVWAGTSDGLFEIDRVRHEVRSVTRGSPAGSGAGLSSSDVTDAVVADGGNLWVGTANDGINVLRAGSTRWETLPTGSIQGAAASTLEARAVHANGTGERQVTAAPARVTALEAASDGTVWASSDASLFHIDSTTGEATLYEHEPSNPWTMAPGSVDDIHRDRDGLIWVAVRTSGVDFMDPGERAAQWITVPWTEPNAAARNNVQQVVALQGGQRELALIHTGAGSELTSIDGTARRPVPDEFGCTNTVEVVTGLRVWCIGEGVTGYDAPTDRWEVVTRDLPKVLGTSRPVATPDGRGGAWLVTASGFARVAADGHVTESHGLAGLARPIPPGSLTDVVLVGHDLLIAGNATGVLEVDTETLAIAQLGFDQDGTDLGLAPADESVVDVATDSAGRLFAAGPLGLDVYSPHRDMVWRFNAANGLASNNVRSVLVDGDVVWAGHDSGVDRLDLRSGKVVHVGTADGLQPSVLAPRAIGRTADGSVVLGGAGGINILERNPRPRLACALGPSLNGAAKAGIPIGFEAHRIKVDAGVAMLRLSYSQACFARSEAARLRYRVDEGPWEAMRPGMFELSFPVPVPGEHRVEVQAFDRRSKWLPADSVLTIDVVPPWWQRRGVIAGILGGIGLSVALAWRESSRRSRRLTETLELRVAEQTSELRSAYDRANAALSAQRDLIDVVAHDVRAPLVRQMTYLGMLDAEPMVADAKVLQLEAYRMDEMLNELLLAREGELLGHPVEVRTVDLHSVLAGAVARAGGMAEEKGIALHLSMPDEHLAALADAAVCDDVFDNLISNAIKYSHRDAHVYISAERAAPIDPDGWPMIEVRLRDLGVGVDAHDLPRLFTRFGRGSQRPTAGEGSTGLGLFAVRQLLNRIGATVNLYSAGVGRGSTVTVSMRSAEAKPATRERSTESSGRRWRFGQQTTSPN